MGLWTELDMEELPHRPQSTGHPMPKTWDQHRCGSGPKAPLGQGVVSGELPVQGATFGCSVASSLLSCPLQVQSHVMVSTVTLYIRRRPPRLPSVSEQHGSEPQSRGPAAHLASTRGCPSRCVMDLGATGPRSSS